MAKVFANRMPLKLAMPSSRLGVDSRIYSPLGLIIAVQKIPKLQVAPQEPTVATTFPELTVGVSAVYLHELSPDAADCIHPRS